MILKIILSLHRSISHTKSKKNNWWYVDLGKTFPIHLVLVHHRYDRCCKKRINGAKVRIKQL